MADGQRPPAVLKNFGMDLFGGTSLLLCLRHLATGLVDPKRVKDLERVVLFFPEFQHISTMFLHKKGEESYQLPRGVVKSPNCASLRLTKLATKFDPSKLKTSKALCRQHDKRHKLARHLLYQRQLRSKRIDCWLFVGSLSALSSALVDPPSHSRCRRT